MKIRPIAAFILAALVLFSLAACGKEEAPPKETVQTETLTPKPGLTGKDPAEEEPKAEEPEAAGPAPLQVLIADHYTAEYETEGHYRLLCGVAWNTLALGPESAAAYPALAAALEELRAEDESYAKEFMEEMLPYAEEELAWNPEYFYGFTSESTYLIQRADEQILSIRADENTYTGGVHPNYWTYGINIDPATGEKIVLTDVLTTIDDLPNLLTEKLQNKYPDEPFENLPDALMEYSADDYAWTMDYQGITFWFSPYEIAAYASGLLTVRINFKEMPDLFVPEYTQIPDGSWALPLPLYSDVEIDGHDLWLGAYEQEDGLLAVSLTHNGTDYPLSELYSYFIRPYLVCHGDRYFLYIEMTAENDYNSFYVYELTDEGLVPRQVIENAGFDGIFVESEDSYGTWYEEVLTTPDHFALSSTIQCLGTWTGYRQYHIDPASGSIIPETEEYTVDGESRPIVSAIDLEVTLLPEEKQETIPAGTEFRLCRTDGEGNAELALPDGRLCRIEIKWNEEVWERQINGIAEQECFTDLLYAG